MLEIVQEDMFAYGSGTLINPVNSKGISGAGLAKTFARFYPINNFVLRSICGVVGRLPDGFITIYEDADASMYNSVTRIINLPTKRDWKDYASDPELIRAGLDTIVNSWKRRKLYISESEPLLFPLLGAGLGRLERSQSIELIEELYLKLRKVSDMPLRHLHIRVCDYHGEASMPSNLIAPNNPTVFVCAPSPRNLIIDGEKLRMSELFYNLSQTSSNEEILTMIQEKSKAFQEFFMDGS